MATNPYPDSQQILRLPDITQAVFLFACPSLLWRNRAKWSRFTTVSIAQLTIVKNTHFLARFSAGNGFVPPVSPLGHLALSNGGNDRILLCHILTTDNSKGYWQIIYSGPTVIDRYGHCWVIDKLRDRRTKRGESDG